MITLTQSGGGPETVLSMIQKVTTPATKTAITTDAALLVANSINEVTGPAVNNLSVAAGVEGDFIVVQNQIRHKINVKLGTIVLAILEPGQVGNFENLGGAYVAV